MVDRKAMLNEARVVEFHCEIAEAFDFLLVLKRRQWLMRFIGWVLELLRIQKQSVFLERYAITIGKRVYTPWAPGIGDTGQLMSQVCVLCHEANHVLQWRADRLMQIKYLFSAKKRAQYEAWAMEADIDMACWFYDSIPDGFIDKLAQGLESYALKPKHINAVKAYLQDYAGNNYTNTVASWARSWWKHYDQTGRQGDES